MNNNNDCPICLTELNNNVSGVDCGGKHKYHKKCISEWRQGQGKSTCPKCRQNIGINNSRNTVLVPWEHWTPKIWAGRHGFTQYPPENRQRMRPGTPPRRLGYMPSIGNSLRRRRIRNYQPRRSASPVRIGRDSASPLRIGRGSASPARILRESPSPQGCFGKFCKYIGLGGTRKNIRRKRNNKKTKRNVRKYRKN